MSKEDKEDKEDKENFKMAIHEHCPFAEIDKKKVEKVVKTINSTNKVKNFFAWIASITGVIVLIASSIYAAGTTMERITGYKTSYDEHVLIESRRMDEMEKEIQDMDKTMIEIRSMSQDIRDIKAVLMRIVEQSISDRRDKVN